MCAFSCCISASLRRPSCMCSALSYIASRQAKSRTVHFGCRCPLDILSMMTCSSRRVYQHVA